MLPTHSGSRSETGSCSSGATAKRNHFICCRSAPRDRRNRTTTAATAVTTPTSEQPAEHREERLLLGAGQPVHADRVVDAVVDVLAGEGAGQHAGHHSAGRPDDADRGGHPPPPRRQPPVGEHAAAAREDQPEQQQPVPALHPGAEDGEGVRLARGWSSPRRRRCRRSAPRPRSSAAPAMIQPTALRGRLADQQRAHRREHPEPDPERRAPRRRSSPGEPSRRSRTAYATTPAR